MLTLLGREFLGWKGFLFYCFCFSLPRILNILCYYLLDYKVSAEKSANGLKEVSLYITSCFCLADFKILSLSLIGGWGQLQKLGHQTSVRAAF